MGDDSLGPLGPLGQNAAPDERGPALPQKEQLSKQNARQPSTSAQGAMSASAGTMSTVDLSNSLAEDGLGSLVGPPPVQRPEGATVRRETQPSVSIEQAARPTFDISVGDPHKVGDLTSSHIVYQVRTKVMMSLRQGCISHLTYVTDIIKSI